jgi:hypothetical protein
LILQQSHTLSNTLPSPMGNTFSELYLSHVATFSPIYMYPAISPCHESRTDSLPSSASPHVYQEHCTNFCTEIRHQCQTTNIRHQRRPDFAKSFHKTPKPTNTFASALFDSLPRVRLLLPTSSHHYAW